MSGPPPKPAHLRQRTNRKSSAAMLVAADDAAVPVIPNPDDRTWHQLTLDSWDRAWRSAVASQWLETDVDALGRLAILWDEFYKKPTTQTAAEVRLQEQRFGITPLDRSRLQWEIGRAEESANKRPRPERTMQGDPRRFLSVVP